MCGCDSNAPQTTVSQEPISEERSAVNWIERHLLWIIVGFVFLILITRRD